VGIKGIIVAAKPAMRELLKNREQKGFWGISEGVDLTQESIDRHRDVEFDSLSLWISIHVTYTT